MSCRCSCSRITPRSRAVPTSTSRGISPSPSRWNSAVLKTTPFHERTAALCVSHAWRRWAGHVVASSYELTHEREYHVIRSAAALFDVSPLYKYVVRGRDAIRLLDLIVPRDVINAQVGQVLYTPWCDHAGKVIDDGTVTRLSEDTFRMTSAEPNLRWLEDNAAGMDVTITDASDSMAALSLQGPMAWSILQSLGAPTLKYFRLAPAAIRDIPVEISRTGYTGDLGFEIWMDGAKALPVWDALMEAGRGYGIMPAGMLALDIARIEAGLMLIDVDYVPARKVLIDSQLSSPYELDLGWTVNLNKERFIGRDALASEKARGARWQFVGIELEWNSLERLYAEVGLATRLPSAAWRMSVPIYSGGEQVGYATSGGWSPLLKKYIALAHLRAPWFAVDTPLEMEITVEHRRKRAAARVVKKPFFDPPRKKA
ncbi:MAG: aminomethyltransferase family protein [Betaproteobacteria bacterium]|nr:aminomethyltransferase family protein [Betaproteobacteria bacterium]